MMRNSKPPAGSTLLTSAMGTMPHGGLLEGSRQCKWPSTYHTRYDRGSPSFPRQSSVPESQTLLTVEEGGDTLGAGAEADMSVSNAARPLRCFMPPPRLSRAEVRRLQRPEKSW